MGVSAVLSTTSPYTTRRSVSPAARGAILTTMDLGEPTSYLMLNEGTAVLSCDGERIGTVAHVLADANVDIFDGLVIDTPDGHRFADAPEVAAVHERGVTLKLDAGQAGRLPPPHANPATLETGPGDTVPEHLHDKLKRAWYLISGDY